MSDDIQAEAEAANLEKIEAISAKFDDYAIDSDEETSDEDSTDSTNDSDSDSDDSTSDEEETDEAPEKDPEPNFSFRETPTNIQNFINKLENLSPEEREQKITALDPVRNKKEIEAAREKFVELKEDKVTLTREEFAAFKKELEDLKELGNTKEVVDMMRTLQQDKPVLEEQLAQRMLRDRFGEKADEILHDEAFKKSFQKFAPLELADRLEEACYRTPIARNALIEAEAKKQVKQKALKTRESGKTGTDKGDKTTSGKDLITADGIMKRFGAQLEAFNV